MLESIDHETVSTAIRFQGGPFHSEVWWLPTLGIWAHFGYPPSQKANRDRFWNVFGVGRPGKSVKIICEINSPFEGLKTRIGGAFAADGTGGYVILHRGNFRAHGLTKSLFLQRYRGPKVRVLDGGERRTLALILELGSASAAHDLRDFIYEVGRIKGLL